VLNRPAPDSEKHIFVANNPGEMLDLARQIHQTFPDDRVFVLNGDLGSGKTTFVKAFVKMIGLEEEVSSPTFSIVHEYGGLGNKIFHFDLYRVKSEQELYQIGFEEYLEQGAYVFIEWPEIAESFLPGRYVKVNFDAKNKNTRQVEYGIVNNS
jgi:tRNA threonylcarbamoyladenosine biosynthesis protein TsaE